MIQYSALLYRRTKYFWILAALIFFTFPGLVRTQNPAWNSTLVITPNPSPALSDWQRDPRILSFTVTYTGKSPATVTFKGTLSSVRFGAIGDVHGNTMQFTAGPTTKIFRNTEVLSIQESHLSGKIVGIVKQTGRLPEDEYTLCIAVLNELGAQLTQACATFSISLGAQPQLVYPLNKDTVRIIYPTFQWTPVLKTPSLQAVRYAFRLCEVLPGQTPEKALTANPPQLEHLVSGAAMLLYPSDALPLQKGKSYVWQIQAVDANGLPATVNEGRSELWTFIYNTGSSQNETVTHPPSGMKDVSGILMYTWPGASIPPSPVRNSIVALEVFYVIHPQSGAPVLLKSSETGTLSPASGSMLSWTTTDANGNFDFEFTSDDSIGCIKNDTTWTVHASSAHGGGYNYTISGSLYRVTRVVVKNQSYLSPSNDIIYASNIFVDVGTLTAIARRYDLRVQVSDPFGPGGAPQQHFIARITRTRLKDDLPVEEDRITRTSGSQGTTYTLTDSVSSGQAIFPCLVQTRDQNDAYTLDLLSSSGQPNVSYQEIETGFDGRFPDDWTDQYLIPYNGPDKSVWTSDYYEVPQLLLNVTPATVSTILTGHLTYHFPNDATSKPLPYVNTHIAVRYILQKTEGGYVDVSDWVNRTDANEVLAYGTTDSTGYVQYNLSLSMSEVNRLGENWHVDNFQVSSGEFPNYYSGFIHRTYRVIIDNPYYCSPDQDTAPWGDIDIDEYHMQDFGTLSCLVRSFIVRVFLKDQNNGYPINNIDVCIGRIIHPNTVPSDEGDYTGYPKTMQYGYFHFDIVAKGTTTIDENGNAGRITFTRFVKRDDYNPQDKYYIVCQSNPQALENYSDFSEFILYNCDGEKAIYNQDYIYPKICTFYRSMNPERPRVTVKLRRSDASAPAVGVPVYLSTHGEAYGDVWSAQSDTSGSVVFSDLPPNPNGPSRDIYIFGPTIGYNDTSLTVINLDLGQKSDLGVVVLRPRSHITGNIVDETGKAIDAWVRVNDGNCVLTKCHNYVVALHECERYYFSLPAPTGSDKITIEPVNQDKYFSRDTTVIVNTTSSIDVGNIVVFRKLHRLKFFVEGVKKAASMYAAMKLKGALVQFMNIDTNIIHPQYTDSQGLVSFLFESDSKTFQVQVSGPSDQNYVSASPTVVDSCSSNWNLITVALQKGGQISGTVYVGKSDVVAGATVFMDVGTQSNFSSNMSQFSVKSSADGSYILHNIPLGTHTFYGVKGGTIGDSMIVIVGENDMKVFQPLLDMKTGKRRYVPMAASSIDFYLRIYQDMDISELFGIPIEVMKFTDLSGGKIKISGRFVSIPSSQAFQIDTNVVVTFSDVIAIAGKRIDTKNVPFIYPIPGYVRLNEMNFDIEKIFNTFHGSCRENGTGVLSVEESGTTELGVIRGKVAIYAGSFATGNAISFPTDSVWIAYPPSKLPGIDRLSIAAASADPSIPVPVTFNVNDFKGNSLRYSLHTFINAAIADSALSSVQAGKLLLQTRLQTNISNISPSNLNIDIGSVTVTPNNVPNINSTDSITIRLEMWRLISRNWSLNAQGLLLHKGVVSTGVVDIPFTNDLPITPTSLETDKASFQFSNMTLGGILPIQLSGDILFGYDASIGYQDPKGHWVLRVLTQSGAQYCGSLNNLVGTNIGDKILINSLYLLSDGESIFSLTPNAPPLTLYRVTSFTPAKIVVFPNRVNIPGSIDLGIPLVGNDKTTSIDYYLNNGNVAFSLSTPIPFSFNTKGVHIEVPATPKYPQSLDDNGFLAQGTVSEDGKYNFQFQLYRTTDSTSLWLLPNQSINISSSGMIQLEKMNGSMIATSSGWNNFWFDGDLIGAKAASGRLKFTVTGDIKADDQQIQLTNIPSPFGNIQLTYDFENHRLVGSVDFSQGIDLGPASISGSATILFDDDGWYFLGTGSINLVGLGGQAALLFGDYPITGDIRSKFAQYSWIYQTKGSLSEIFPVQNIKGFFGEGNFQLPVIPEIKFNFFIVDAKLWCNLGADMFMSMNFGGGGTYGMGVYVYGSAGLQLGVSVLIACAGVEASAIVYGGYMGQVQGNGDWSASGDIGVKLCGSAYCGWGICDSECDGTFCDKHSVGGCVGIGLTGTFGSSGCSLSPYIK